MPITSINFSTSQENVNKIGLRSWKKFGAEYQVEAGENLEDAKKALKDFVYCSMKKQQDEIPEETVKQPESPSIPETPEQREAKIIADIYTCKELKVLESYRLIAKNYPAIMAAFEQQFKKLS